MDNQLRKNRRTIILIAAMSLVPFVIAWYLSAHPDIVSTGTNHGQLIAPPLPTEASEFVGLDDFSAKNIKELQGHWIMINVTPGSLCNKACDDSLVKTRQITLMMGKDIARIRRLLIFPTPASVTLSQQWRDDARLLKVVSSDSLRRKLAQLGVTEKEGALIIMDPLGNLMMQYAPGYDPYNVRNDLGKLLRISQIG